LFTQAGWQNGGGGGGAAYQLARVAPAGRGIARAGKINAAAARLRLRHMLAA
jgi:hypothetical protein